MATPQERLAELDSAISAVLNGGQEIQTRTGRVKMPDLATLQKQRADVLREIEAANASSSTAEVVYLGGYQDAR